MHFQPRKFSLNFRKLYINIVPCKLNLCDTWNCAISGIFVDLFEFSWNFIYFRSCKIPQNLKKLVILLIFIFCLVNWTHVTRWIEQKAGFFRSIWIFFYVLEFYLFLASKIIKKLQHLFYFNNIYILSCKLDLRHSLTGNRDVTYLG